MSGPEGRQTTIRQLRYYTNLLHFYINSYREESKVTGSHYLQAHTNRSMPAGNTGLIISWTWYPRVWSVSECRSQCNCVRCTRHNIFNAGTSAFNPTCYSCRSDLNQHIYLKPHEIFITANSLTQLHSYQATSYQFVNLTHRFCRWLRWSCPCFHLFKNITTCFGL
jgi:hypothetical protein